MYDITFIAKEEKDPTIKKTILELGGKIISEDFFGRKKLSYKINKEDAGFYTTYVFELDPDKLIEISKKLKLNTDIIRYLIITKKKIMVRKVKEIKKIETGKKDVIKEVPTSIDSVSQPEPVSPSQGGSVGKEKVEESKVEVKEPEKQMKTETKKPFIKPIKKTEIKVEKVDEEERLKKLEEKLNELLKD